MLTPWEPLRRYTLGKTGGFCIIRSLQTRYKGVSRPLQEDGDYRTMGLRDYKTTRQQDYRTTGLRLQDDKTTGLRLQDYKTTGLQDCGVILRMRGGYNCISIENSAWKRLLIGVDGSAPA